MAEAAIFYDPTGRRRKRFRLALVLFLLLVVLSLGALGATIQLLPAAEPLPVALERGKALPAPQTSLLARTERRAVPPSAAGAVPAAPGPLRP